jgi:hypothetical protein
MFASGSLVLGGRLVKNIVLNGYLSFTNIKKISYFYNSLAASYKHSNRDLLSIG